METRKPNFFYLKPFSEKKTNWLDLARKKPTQLSLTKWWLFIRRSFIAKSGSKQWMKWRKFKHPSINLATFLNLILKSNVIHNSKKTTCLVFHSFFDFTFAWKENSGVLYSRLLSPQHLICYFLVCLLFGYSHQTPSEHLPILPRFLGIWICFSGFLHLGISVKLHRIQLSFMQVAGTPGSHEWPQTLQVTCDQQSSFL